MGENTRDQREAMGKWRSKEGEQEEASWAAAGVLDYTGPP